MASRRGSVASYKAFQYLRHSPRVNDATIVDNPGAYTTGRLGHIKYNYFGQSHKELQQGGKPPLGWLYGDFYIPWFRVWPSDRTYNKDAHLKREYPPLSLLELQRMIDLGYLDVSKPIDLTSLCNTKLYRCNPTGQQFGVQLTDEGSEIFCAKVCLEVQWASELAIATVERNGGSLTTAYYDPISLDALVDPVKFFAKGEPVPKRAFPPIDCIEYYTDAKCRGYLSNPAKLSGARKELAQKYGYAPVDPSKDPLFESLFSQRKDPLQVFYGLAPGSVVNLADETVLKPKNPELLRYYST